MSNTPVLVLDAAWIKKHHPCPEEIEWGEKLRTKDARKVIEKLISEKRYDWADWTLARLLLREDLIRWAAFSAEQVLPIFEKAYPDDKRPRLAIEAAKKCIKDNSKENRDAAGAARAAAWAAWAAGAAGAAWNTSVAAYNKMRRKCSLYGLRLLKTTKVKGKRK